MLLVADWFVVSPLLYVLMRLVGLEKKPTTPLLFLESSHANELKNRYLRGGVGSVYHGTARGGETVAENWVYVPKRGKHKGCPMVGVTLALLNRRTKPLKNMMVRYRITRAGMTPDMVPPLYTPMPAADIAIEGEHSLTGYVLPPNTRAKLITLSFVPGRKYVEDLVNTDPNKKQNVDSLETRGDTGYQWWDFRVEVDDDGGELDDECIAANTFGTFVMVVPENRFFRPRETFDVEAPEPTSKKEKKSKETKSKATKKTKGKAKHGKAAGPSSGPDKKYVYPGDELQLPDEPSEIKIKVHDPQEVLISDVVAAKDAAKGLKKKQRKGADMTESANPLHAESGAFETESALEPEPGPEPEPEPEPEAKLEQQSEPKPQLVDEQAAVSSATRA